MTVCKPVEIFITTHALFSWVHMTLSLIWLM